MEKCDSKCRLLIDVFMSQLLFWKLGTELTLALLKEDIGYCSEILSETRKQVIHSATPIHSLSRTAPETADKWAIFTCFT